MPVNYGLTKSQGAAKSRRVPIFGAEKIRIDCQLIELTLFLDHSHEVVRIGKIELGANAFVEHVGIEAVGAQ